MAATMPSTSIEYVRVPVTASVTLDTQGVSMALTLRTGGNPTTPTTWQTAEWTGSPATTRTARLLIGPLAAGAYDCWIRVDDVSEHPVRVAGTVTVT